MQEKESKCKEGINEASEEHEEIGMEKERGKRRRMRDRVEVTESE